MAAQRADVAVVGAGIIGLAHAYALARRGHAVTVYERSPQAAGASVRNFGMIWPIGQAAGRMHEMAMRSRQLWIEVLHAARLPYFPTGSLLSVYRADEADVAREFCAVAPGLGYPCAWLNTSEALARSAALRPKALDGAIWSPTEITVDPRVALAQLPRFLTERFGVRFCWSTAVRDVDSLAADAAIVCTGHDFETLYPEMFGASGITRCKLQMMRTHPQPDGWQLGPALAAGLTLRFYESFRICRTLPALQQRITEQMPAYDRYGIHVLVSQTANGELTIGDSHEYGAAIDPFDRTEIDDLILRYAGEFLAAPTLEIAQRWHGVYAKHPDKPYVSLAPAPGVRVVTATGGSGMTLSFGLAEETMQEMGL
ncbi:MAG TPA: TIGR03364 family FAD-dependent oxidoreductase [Bryobacteraceae bacterium]|jgi:FAD dependent oxidoreductase TIGR03364|nr:TIGR03364 family FAD-dependent oxidoreductase [Bryobacteraceae bacterium]